MASKAITARRLLLGREIGHMIRRARLSQAQAGKLIDVGQSRINNLVNGTGSLSPAELRELAAGLGVTDPRYVEILLELRGEDHPRNYWNGVHRRAYGDIRLLVDLETMADRIRDTACEIVPGLLQHPDYIRALHEPLATDPDDDPDAVTVEEYVQARLDRQQHLLKPDAPHVHAVLSESCLRRYYGSDEVMYAQLQHLIELAERANVTIQVLPFTHIPPGAGIHDRFTLLRVPSPGRAGALEMAVVESSEEIRYLDDTSAVAARDATFTRLVNHALNPADSRQFMHHMARAILARPAMRT